MDYQEVLCIDNGRFQLRMPVTLDGLQCTSRLYTQRRD